MSLIIIMMMMMSIHPDSDVYTEKQLLPRPSFSHLCCTPTCMDVVKNEIPSLVELCTRQLIHQLLSQDGEYPYLNLPITIIEHVATYMTQHHCWTPHVLHLFSQVRTLNLNHANIGHHGLFSLIPTHIPPHPHQLQTLLLTYTSINDKQLELIANQLQRLMHLDISSCINLTHRGVIYMSHYCNQLVHLGFNNMSHIDSEAMAHVFLAGKLQCLELENTLTKYHDVAGYAHSIQSGTMIITPHLRQLNASKCRMQALNIQSLLQMTPCIETLDLSYALHVTNEMVYYMTNTLNHLLHLTLNGIDTIDHKMLPACVNLHSLTIKHMQTIRGHHVRDFLVNYPKSRIIITGVTKHVTVVCDNEQHDMIDIDIDEYDTFNHFIEQLSYRLQPPALQPHTLLFFMALRHNGAHRPRAHHNLLNHGSLLVNEILFHASALADVGIRRRQKHQYYMYLDQSATRIPIQLYPVNHAQELQADLPNHQHHHHHQQQQQQQQFKHTLFYFVIKYWDEMHQCIRHLGQTFVPKHLTLVDLKRHLWEQFQLTWPIEEYFIVKEITACNFNVHCDEVRGGIMISDLDMLSGDVLYLERKSNAILNQEDDDNHNHNDADDHNENNADDDGNNVEMDIDHQNMQEHSHSSQVVHYFRHQPVQIKVQETNSSFEQRCRYNHTYNSTQFIDIMVEVIPSKTTFLQFKKMLIPHVNIPHRHIKIYTFIEPVEELRGSADQLLIDVLPQTTWILINIDMQGYYAIKKPLYLVDFGTYQQNRYTVTTIDIPESCNLNTLQDCIYYQLLVHPENQLLSKWELHPYNLNYTYESLEQLSVMTSQSKHGIFLGPLYHQASIISPCSWVRLDRIHDGTVNKDSIILQYIDVKTYQQQPWCHIVSLNQEATIKSLYEWILKQQSHQHMQHMRIQFTNVNLLYRQIMFELNPKLYMREKSVKADFLNNLDVIIVDYQDN